MSNNRAQSTTSPSPRRPRLVAAAGVVCAFALLVTGCGSDSDGGGGGDLLGALDRLAPDDKAEDMVTWVDAEKVRPLAKEDERRFKYTSQNLGSPLLGGYTGWPMKSYGIDTDQIDRVVSAGQKTGVWEGSFDADGITAKMEKDGYRKAEKDGHTVWSKEGESVSFEITDDGISYVTKDVGWGLIDPEKDSYGDDPDFRWVAKCFGDDLYRADFYKPSPKEPVRLMGTGQAAKSADETYEVLCARTDSEKTAEKAATALRKVIKEEPKRYKGSEVTVLDGDEPGVKVNVPDDPDSGREAGRLLVTDYSLLLALGDL